MRSWKGQKTEEIEITDCSVLLKEIDISMVLWKGAWFAK